MKKKTKIILASTGTVLLVGLSGAGYFIYQNVIPHATSIDKNATVQSNYYQAINKKWLEKAKIPSDKPAQNAFGEISDDVKDTLKSDVKKMVQAKESTTSNDQKEFVELYQEATDFKQRQKDGIKPVKTYLEQIESLSSYDDFKGLLKDWTLSNMPLPFGITVSSDPYHSENHMINLSSPSTILPDVSYYKDKKSKHQLLSVYKKSAVKVLTLMGYSNKQAKTYVKDAISFDSLMVPYTPTSEEMSEVQKTVHITDTKKLASYGNDLALDQTINQLVGQDVSQVNVVTPKYYKNLHKIVNKKHFKLMKSWMIVNEAMDDAQYLTEDLRQASSEYSLYLSGTSKTPSKTDAAFEAVTGAFSETISVYYGQKYFGENAKKDVTGMIDHIISVYKKRLSNNDWLSDQTKQEAETKLEKMHYYIGYPDHVSDLTKSYHVDKSKTFFENLTAIGRQAQAYRFARYAKPVDKSIWEMPSYTVNAYYTPTENAIYFPAAILQAPFYSEKQTAASNYGGIGAVIGHEITHAFDNNGAQFDEYGNMKNWWSKSDYKAFKQKTRAMTKLFDGLEIYGGKVNGKLTVSENIADAGGLSASYEALHHTSSSVNDKKYFENWARIWRQKSSEQYAKYLLTVDSHSPNELRANRQLSNFDPFYKTYQIDSNDKMYLPAKQRVSIW